MMLPEDEKIEKIEDQYKAESQAEKAKIRPNMQERNSRARITEYRELLVQTCPRHV